MKHIIEAFSMVFVFVLSLLLCINVSAASGAAAAAKEYKADIIAEIENSNFNPVVITECIDQAQAAGYTLEVSGSTYDENHHIQTAEVVLSYSYSMPVFGISETKTTRGIAR